MEDTNGEETGLNRYDKAKLKDNILSLEVQNGVQKGQRWNRS